jgi:hypothetical protein
MTIFFANVITEKLIFKKNENQKRLTRDSGREFQMTSNDRKESILLTGSKVSAT